MGEVYLKTKRDIFGLRLHCQAYFVDVPLVSCLLVAGAFQRWVRFSQLLVSILLPNEMVEGMTRNSPRRHAYPRYSPKSCFGYHKVQLSSDHSEPKKIGHFHS